MDPWVLSQDRQSLMRIGTLFIENNIVKQTVGKKEYILGEYADNDSAINVLSRIGYYIDSNRKSGGLYKMPKAGN